MTQYINKAAVVGWIKSLKDEAEIYPSDFYCGRLSICKELMNFIDSLEVKEVEDKFDVPDIDIKDAIEVISRLKYIDDDLRPIANFIMRYAHWNLHKDECNQPTIEVPLFRVLDALIQRGKNYCEG